MVATGISVEFLCRMLTEEGDCRHLLQGAPFHCCSFIRLSSWQAELRMIRWMCGVEVTHNELRERDY